jgi:PD-(D/E)XK nuclease superfamily
MFLCVKIQPPMNTDKHRLELDELTEKIIGGAFAVSNTLGCGFLEKVYDNALAHELRKRGIKFSQQQPIHVQYDGVIMWPIFLWKEKCLSN